MATTDPPPDNTTAPPPDKPTTVDPGSVKTTTSSPPTNIANTTPAATPTTTQPGNTLLNSNIIGEQLGTITHPKIGAGGVPDSYAKTVGFVQIMSVGINKRYNGKLTYEVFDLYGVGAPVDPVTVYRGETSVVNWDESSQFLLIK